MENREDLANGSIVFVEDDKGMCLPYICPEELANISNLTFDYGEKKQEKDLNLDELLALPTYMLREYLSKYKNNNLIYKVIKKELEERGVYENKQYKLRKEFETIESTGINDSYKRRRKIKNSTY